MEFNLATFPLVEVRYGTSATPDLSRFLGAFEQALDKQQRFVLISPDQPQETGDPEQDQAIRKQLILWIKQQKTRLSTLVVGHIMVEANPDTRQTLASMAPMTEKVWGYPLYVCADQLEASALAKQLLDKATDPA